MHEIVKGSKILITGASGMVGKNILEHSETINYELLVPSRTEMNLLDQEKVRKYISENKPDLVIHAAGLVGGIQANIKNPVSFLYDNLAIGMNVVNSAYDIGIKNVMNLGSSCMYPKDSVNPIIEDALLTGKLEPTNEGYALAKIAICKFCEYISQKNSLLNYKTVIPCNIFGRHDKFHDENSHLVPALIKKIHEAKRDGTPEVTVWGDGRARREFMYAQDLADCIWYLIKHFGQLPQNINIGMGTDHTINEYYEAVAEVVGYNGKFVHDLTKPVGMMQKLVDSSEVRKLGWSPRWSLKQSVQETYEYFKKEQDK